MGIVMGREQERGSCGGRCGGAFLVVSWVGSGCVVMECPGIGFEVRRYEKKRYLKGRERESQE